MPADNCNLSSKAEKEVFFLFAGQTLFFAVALFFMFRNKISPRERENMWKKKKHFLTKRPFHPWNTWPIELFIWSKYGSDKRSYSNVDKTLIVALTDIMASRPHRSLGQFLFFLFFSSHFSAIGAFDLIAGAYVFGVYHIGLESHTTCSANNNHASNKGNLRWGRLRNV